MKILSLDAISGLYFGCIVMIAPGVAGASAPVAEVQVTTNHVHLSDVVHNAPAELADIDLGVSPGAGGSRIFDKGELALALGDKASRVSLPNAIRIVRKMHKLDVAEVTKTATDGITHLTLWRGVTLAKVKPTHSSDVPEGWTKINIEIPKPPRRSGTLSTNATLAFETDGETTAKVIVPIELTLSEDAAKPEVAHGAMIQLVVKRGLVEVATPATAGADGDAGDVISVTVQASNRVLRARVQDATHVVALDGV